MERGVAPTRPSAATAGTLCPKVLPPPGVEVCPWT
jgi:hypothetical protein